MYNNSDGYILIDMKDVNMTLSTQHINGIFNRIVEVIDTNKLAVVINAGDNTPMAAIVHKKFNYYVINTTLYIFTINSNDIVIVEEAGQTTVDVEIVPTLMSGTKIADYAIGAVTGELFAPTPTSEINDSVIAENSTWSSDKINTELSGKADSSSLASVATSGSYSDLSNKPTIPTKTSELTNDSGFITSAQVPTIDDSTVSSTSVWSSYKTSEELGNKANSSDVYNKSEVNTELALKQNITDNSLTTTSKTIVGGINEINSLVGDLILYQTLPTIFDSTGRGTYTNPAGYIPISAQLDVNWNVVIHSSGNVVAHGWQDYNVKIISNTVSITYIFVKA